MEINICRGFVNTKEGEKTDKRLMKTKKAIIGAMLELISEKNVADITVTELALRAKINRKTFYLHYNSIDDVIDDFADDLFCFAAKTIKDNVRGADGIDITSFFDAVNRAIQENLEFFRMFVRSGAYHIFVGQAIRRQCLSGIKYILSSKLRNDDITSYTVEYMVSGATAMYIKWLSTEEPILTLEELSRCACDLVKANYDRLYGAR